ncbi:hypothetical protein OOK31_19110 [Streptomyces sp. NBC_00249]|uniref:hypothetical protein n=1 Tax=Streptomyces sp. NBC_00249 TaxID=2975690 RepID=UPI002253F860|nr:hypothetical protein [Streptomyces sp. NBC_00249]MCX5195976.1 hypothetical protein [Streptomyces sp. NBC_00249]
MNERQPYEITLVRAGPQAAAAETTVIRLVGLLPAHWTFTQRVEREPERIVMLVHPAHPPGSAGPDAEAVRAWLARTLTDDALRGWHAEGP